MEPSIFTRIIKGEIPCHKIYEDDQVIAFLDIHPAVSGHTLVVSKSQVDHVWDLGEDDYSAMFAAAKKLAPVLQKTFNTKRCVLKIEGYDVAHAHLHLLPANESSDIQKQDFTTDPDHDALASLANRIKEDLSDAE